MSLWDTKRLLFDHFCAADGSSTSGAATNTLHDTNLWEIGMSMCRVNTNLLPVWPECPISARFGMAVNVYVWLLADTIFTTHSGWEDICWNRELSPDYCEPTPQWMSIKKMKGMFHKVGTTATHSMNVCETECVRRGSCWPLAGSVESELICLHAVKYVPGWQDCNLGSCWGWWVGSQFFCPPLMDTHTGVI